MSVFPANKSSLEALWEYAKPHIERFSDETLLADPSDILQDLKEGNKQLWLVEKSGSVAAVAVTQIYETRKGRVCCIWAACGTLGIKGIAPAFNEIEKWARDIDCVALEIKGRKGWARILPEFKQTAICLEKDLRRVH